MPKEPESFSKIITIDCSELEPPEPFVKVLEAVQDMGKDEAVLMVHRKPPRLLISRLKELGFHFDLKEGPGESVRLLIWKEE